MDEGCVKRLEGALPGRRPHSPNDRKNKAGGESLACTECGDTAATGGVLIHALKESLTAVVVCELAQSQESFAGGARIDRLACHFDSLLKSGSQACHPQSR